MLVMQYTLEITWTDPSSATISEMVPGSDIRMSGILRCTQWMIQESLWFKLEVRIDQAMAQGDTRRRRYLFWFGVPLWVVVEGPPVDHDDGIFGDEVVAIPVVFDVQVILAEFVHWSPAEDFLVVSE